MTYEQAAARLRSFIETENAKQHAMQTEHYAYLAENDDTDGLTLAQHLVQYGVALKTTGPAKDTDLAALEAAGNTTLPAWLCAFYKDFGSLTGTNFEMDMLVNIYAPQKLLKELSDTSALRLKGLGLSYGICHARGNHLPDFQRGGGGTPDADLDRLDQSFTYFGNIGNGHANGHIHFAFDAAGRICLFHWRADEEFDGTPDLTSDAPLPELLAKCFEAEVLVRASDDEDDYFDTSELIHMIKTGTRAPWR